MELSELAGTAGLEVVGSTYQRVNMPNPRTYIGSGKVREVRRSMQALGCCTVILDDELSPGQQRNLENEFGGEAAGIKVLDRTALILDIFAQHARTKEGFLQVELAMQTYRLPRLTKLWTHLERQSASSGGGNGGVGLRGPGERQLEVDRRLLRGRIIGLKKQIEEVRTHRELHRRKRANSGFPVVALVGYTNAGKSTVLNYLSQATSQVLAENMLFATLDPTTRRCRLQGTHGTQELLVTDTVGFIQKLPTHLVAAFRATLEEVTEADILVHVVDISNPKLWVKQKKSVDATLKEMGMADKPVVTLWNKLDAVVSAPVEKVQYEASRRPLTVAASAQTGAGMDQLVVALEAAIQDLNKKVEVLLPYSQGDLLSLCHTNGVVEEEDYRETGVYIRASVPMYLANRVSAYRLDKEAVTGGADLGVGVDRDLTAEEWVAIGRGRHAASSKISSGGGHGDRPNDAHVGVMDVKDQQHPASPSSSPSPPPDAATAAGAA